MAAFPWDVGAVVAGGLWLFIAPWAVPYLMQAEVAALSVIWNHWIVGLGLLLSALAALLQFRASSDWGRVILGLWLAASPWTVGFAGASGLMWNSLLLGAGAVALGTAGLWLDALSRQDAR